MPFLFSPGKPPLAFLLHWALGLLPVYALIAMPHLRATSSEEPSPATPAALACSPGPSPGHYLMGSFHESLPIPPRHGRQVCRGPSWTPVSYLEGWTGNLALTLVGIREVVYGSQVHWLAWQQEEEERYWGKRGRMVPAPPGPRHPSISIQETPCLNQRERLSMPTTSSP